MLEPKIKRLENGLTIIMDFLPYVNSATIGIWTNIGSRVETLENNGICHFLEHMVFKGTKNKDTFEISEAIESKGGYVNAWTSKEKTCWYAKTLSEDINVAVDLLFDIIRNSNFPKEELEKERRVIIEEIKMYLDDPQDLAHNLYDKITYQDHSLSYPIIGSEDNIKKFSQEDFFNHLKKFYYPSNMVVAISGNFNEERFLEEIENQTKDWQNKSIILDLGKPLFQARKDILVKKEIEQTTLLYGLEAVSFKDNNYHKWAVLNIILGSGMSSRFFKEIREKRGLAYYVTSFMASFSDCGTFATQVGCNKDNLQDIINIIKDEIYKASNNLKEEELLKAKKLLKSSIVMSLEDSYKRCYRLASNILDYGEIKDLNEIIKKIENLEIQDIKSLLADLSNQEASIAVVSNEKLSI